MDLPPSGGSFYLDMEALCDQLFKISFAFFSRTTSLESIENCLVGKMASQLVIQPAAKAHARILRLH